MGFYMARELTERESAVLAHVVIDPIAWWAHCNETHPDPEGAIAAKVDRWGADYDAAKDQPGYQTRAQRES